MRKQSGLVHLGPSPKKRVKQGKPLPEYQPDVIRTRLGWEDAEKDWILYQHAAAVEAGQTIVL
eukprot:4941566-Amphidinium_carterae.2